MNNEIKFIIVSIVAFLCLAYIVISNIGNFKLAEIDGQYGTVMLAQQAKNAKSSAVSTSTVKYALPPESPTNYTDNKNGTITDNYTGLLWKKCPQGMSGNDCKSGSTTQREWSKSNTECQALNFAGITGWRIPTLKELQSIVDTGTFNPSINKKFFASSDDPYWTSTSPAEYPASKFTVLFSDGSVYYNSSNNIAATRCVNSINVK